MQSREEQNEEVRDAEGYGPFQIYWKLYGGWPALLGSRYLWMAVIVSAVCYPVWTTREENEFPWLDSAISIIPSLMAFSLGALAILLAFSNQKLLSVVQGRVDSLFNKACASFFHFLLIQVIALLFVFLTRSFDNAVLSGLAFFFMSYGVASVVAASGILLQMAFFANAAATIQDNMKGNTGKEE